MKKPILWAFSLRETLKGQLLLSLKKNPIPVGKDG